MKEVNMYGGEDGKLSSLSPFGWIHAGIPQHKGFSNPPCPAPFPYKGDLKKMTSMRWKSLKFTSMGLILTKWHNNLMGIGETLLPEKRISIRPLSVLWFLLCMLFPLITFRTLWNLVKKKGNMSTLMLYSFI